MKMNMRLQKQPMKNKVLERLMKEMRPKGIPMNFGVQEFKRLLDQNPNLTKSQKRKVIKMYKERAYERFNAIRDQYEKLYLKLDSRLQDEGLVDDENTSEASVEMVQEEGIVDGES